MRDGVPRRGCPAPASRTWPASLFALTTIFCFLAEFREGTAVALLCSRRDIFFHSYHSLLFSWRSWKAWEKLVMVNETQLLPLLLPSPCWTLHEDQSFHQTAPRGSGLWKRPPVPLAHWHRTLAASEPPLIRGALAGSCSHSSGSGLYLHSASVQARLCRCCWLGPHARTSTLIGPGPELNPSCLHHAHFPELEHMTLPARGRPPSL